MNVQTSAPQESFDIQTGMAVYAADGQKIGSVMDIVGFGTTKISRAGEHGSGESVIQAKTGSGYFNVDRTEIHSTRSSIPLCVPFRGIQDVVAGHGVTLNSTIIDELRHQADPRPAKTLVPATKRRRLWPKWL